MRKNIIALMLVLPLLFVFVVFSSGNAASLGISVSASGIVIRNAPEGGLHIDLAEYDNDFRVAAEVLPENASDKSFSYRVEEVEGSAFADVTVDEDGTVHAQSAGSARIVAVSNDGAYTDSMTVVVSSSKPYDMSVSLFEPSGEKDLLTETEEGYEATLSTGVYRYSTALYPSGFAEAEVNVESGFAVLDGDTVLLPFEGDTVLSFTTIRKLRGANPFSQPASQYPAGSNTPSKYQPTEHCMRSPTYSSPTSMPLSPSTTPSPPVFLACRSIPTSLLPGVLWLPVISY